MTKRSKVSLLIVTAAISALTGILVLIMGCSTVPTKTEQRLFNIETNLSTVIEVRTNIVPFTIVRTNIVEVSSVVPGQTQYVTNYIPILAYQTNTITVTNVQESYVFKPGAGADQIKQVGTEVGNVFGVGGMVGTALGALFSLWGYARSKKSLVTAANIAQTVETMREFVRSLPNGQVYDNELVNWMQANQANAGVLQNVIALIEAQVSNPDAQAAARNIHNIVTGLLSGGTAPPPQQPPPTV